MRPGVRHAYTVDFGTVSAVGLESSPVAAALAGLRAHEARYFKNKYDHVFTVEPVGNAKTAIGWVHSSRGRSRSWPEPFAAPTSRLRTSTDRAACEVSHLLVPVDAPLT